MAGAALDMLDSAATQSIDAILCLIVAKLAAGVETLPEEAIQMAREHRDLMVPRLIEALKNAIAAARDEKKPEGNAHFFAAFLLTEFKVQEAFPLLFEAFSLPGRWPEDLLGDAVYELPARMLAIFRGDCPDVIEALIDDRALNENLRWQAAASFLYLVREGRLQREEAVRCLQRHLRLAIDRDDEQIATALVSELFHYGPAEALDDIREAYQRELVDTFMIGLQDVERSIAEGEARFQDELDRCRPLDLDTIEELRRWASFRERPAISPAQTAPAPLPGPATTSAPHFGGGRQRSQAIREPIVSRPARVGRNDLCPCGSGKKFKKCCGARH